MTLAETPNPGSPIRLVDIKRIHDSVMYRQEKFPGEDLLRSLSFVLLNAGECFKTVRCLRGEWEGRKGDLEHTEGIPHCPNGHPLFEDEGMMLVWASILR